MKKLVLFFIFIFSLLFTSCSKHKTDTKFILNDNWTYSIHGPVGPYETIETKDFDRLHDFVIEQRGYIWLKNNFVVPQEFENKNISCYLGIVKVANEFFLNGESIGTNGHFPPNEFPVGEISSAYSLPSELLNYDFENNEIIIKIWVDGYGQLSKTPFISEQQEVVYTKAFSDFISSKIFLLFSILLIVISSIYMLLYLFRKNEKHYLSFSRLAFFSSFFLLTVCVGEYPLIFKKNWNYLLFEQLFHGCSAVIASYFAVSFMRDFLGKVDSKKRIIYRLSLILVSFIIIFSASDLISFTRYMLYIYIIIGIHILYGVRLIIKAIFSNNKNVWLLLIGFSPIMISLVVSIIFYFAKIDISLLLVTAIGWQGTVLFFLGYLIYSLANSQSQVEYLNKNLEKIVKQRTSELEQSNIQLADRNNELQFEKDKTQKEIELASFVQQSFYDQHLPKLKGWEIAYYLKPMAGVSGDLYDIFHNGTELQGLGVFDVSGHGISSGLVTMLVKNIIEQEFFAGTEEKLEDVMYIINDRVIEEKGNIENYLTGVLLRILGSKIELVNAGHPPTLLFRHDKINPEFITETEKQCGVIGIADFPINFETITIEMERGDTLLFYTDGITEAMNDNREEYGKRRLYEAFFKYKDLPLQDQIKSIVNEVYSFRGLETLEDDITLLFLRKT